MIDETMFRAFTCRSKQFLETKRTTIWDQKVQTAEITQCDRLGDLLDFGQLFKAFGIN